MYVPVFLSLRSPNVTDKFKLPLASFKKGVKCPHFNFSICDSSLRCGKGKGNEIDFKAELRFVFVIVSFLPSGASC